MRSARPGVVRGLGSAVLAAGLLGLAAGGCGHEPRSHFEQPDDQPIAVELPGGGVPHSPPVTIRHSSGFALRTPPRSMLRVSSATAKLVPPLDAWVRDSVGRRRVTVVIGYVDPIVFPRLPIEGLESADTLVRLAARNVVQAVVDSIRTLRDSAYAPEVSRLGHAHGATAIHTHLVTQCVTANLRLDALPALAARWEVTSIELVQSGVPPPDDCPDPATVTSTDAFPCEGRRLIGSDPYRDAGLATRAMTMLDTGVNTGHEALSPLTTVPWAPGAQGLRSYDCLLSPDCNSTSAADLDLHGYGHGSKSASILVGLDGGDARYGGITRGWLTAYRVYHSMAEEPDKAELDPDAYQNATTGFIVKLAPPPVLLAETQGGGGVFGPTATAADQLFGMGSVVVAPVGNVGEVPGGGAGSPGVSARVLAVGARPAHLYASTSSSQVSATAPLLRHKPDLQAPNYVLGARSDDKSDYDAFLKTSGAGPFAAGAARIVRNLLAFGDGSQPVKVVDPGQVYAALLACGRNDRPYPPEQGVGALKLPTGGRLFAGRTSVATAHTATVLVPLTPTSATAGCSSRADSTSGPAML